MFRINRYLLLFWGLVLAGGLLTPAVSVTRPEAQPPQPSPVATPVSDTNKKSTVEYSSELTTMRSGNDSIVFMIGKVALHHNGTFMQCDSAYYYQNDINRMEGFGNVLINKDSTFIYGDRISYNGNTNIVQVFSPLLKLVNGDLTMWVYNEMEFNTLTSVGYFDQRGLIVQRDNLIESDRGLYNGDSSTVKFLDHVAMRNDNYKLRTDSIAYNLDTEVVTFLTRTYIWDKDRDYLTAERGRYVRATETYHFTQNAYVMTPEQEYLADTIDYETRGRTVTMYGNIQMLDTVQRTIGLGDFGYYSDSLKKGILTRNPAIIAYEKIEQSAPADTAAVADSIAAIHREETLNVTEGGVEAELEAEKLELEEAVEPDTLTRRSLPDGTPVRRSTTQPVPDSSYMRADSIFFDSYAPGMSKPGAAAEQMLDGRDSLMPSTLSDSFPDGTEVAVSDSLQSMEMIGMEGKTEEYRLVRPQLEGASPEPEAETQPQEGLPAEEPVAGASVLQSDENPETLIGVEEPPEPMAPELAELTETLDSLRQEIPLGDSLSTPDLPLLDSLGNPIVMDSDSLQTVQPRKDSLERVVRAYYNVRMYSADVQAVCDSTIAFSVDSTAMLFGRPKIWNGDNQLTADQINIYTANEQVEYAEYIGDPFIVQKVERTDSLYNQAQSRYMETWFVENEISKALMTGNVMNYYFMAEEDRLPDKMAAVASATLTVDFEDREPVWMNWSGSVKDTIYPVNDLAAAQELRLSGFTWNPELRPMNRYQITTRSVRPSGRREAEGEPEPEFVIEENFLIRREELIQRGTWRDRNEVLWVTIDTFRNRNLLF